ncbi:MAG: RidA family protein [Chitinophagaceae bacterium]|nr:RidA family protein [Chitinophagaceae bacterium]
MLRCFILLVSFFAIHYSFAQTPEQNIAKLGIVLPTPTVANNSFVKFVRTGNLIYFSGQGPTKADGSFVTGKLGRDLTVEEGAAAARLTGINLLSTLQSAIGDLNKVKRIVKVIGMVNCVDNFVDQPKVMNGFSDLMVAVFGEKGKHARSAVGMNSLPWNIAVEIEMIVEVSDHTEK